MRVTKYESRYIQLKLYANYLFDERLLKLRSTLVKETPDETEFDPVVTRCLAYHKTSEK